MPSWSFSAVEAAEPADRAAEEKRVESKEWERKAEKVGSEAKASRGEVEGESETETETDIFSFFAFVLNLWVKGV